MLIFESNAGSSFIENANWPQGLLALCTLKAPFTPLLQFTLEAESIYVFFIKDDCTKPWQSSLTVTSMSNLACVIVVYIYVI